MSNRWLLQVVDKAEEIINFAFIDSFNHRKAARAVLICKTFLISDVAICQ